LVLANWPIGQSNRPRSEFNPNNASRNFNAKVSSSGEAMTTLAEHPAESDLSNSNSGALRRIGMKPTNTLSGAKSTNPQPEKVRRNQSGDQMFGLAATAVFFVMLIMNAISY
jgi:hypothetical protein